LHDVAVLLDDGHPLAPTPCAPKLPEKRPRARIVVESSTESEWVARRLEELGHEVIVADPNFAPMYAQRSRKVKTDRPDARALCEACELGAYRPAHRSSDRSRALRTQVAVREALVQTRTRHISLIRALLRQQGYRVRSGGAATFSERVGELELPDALRAQMAPLLGVMDSVNAQLKVMDKALAEQAKTHEVATRLCTAAGVGPVERRRLKEKYRRQRGLLAALPVSNRDRKRLSQELALRQAIESRALSRKLANQRKAIQKSPHPGSWRHFVASRAASRDARAIRLVQHREQERSPWDPARSS
jgi:hypothetical protein